VPVDSGLLDSNNHLPVDPREKFFEDEDEDSIIQKEEGDLYTQQDFEEDLATRMEEA
jgi:hypothetical protein